LPKEKENPNLESFVLNETFLWPFVAHLSEPFIGKAHLYSNTLPLKCAFVKVNTAHENNYMPMSFLIFTVKNETDQEI
jgi:hypothetical protein